MSDPVGDGRIAEPLYLYGEYRQAHGVEAVRDRYGDAFLVLYSTELSRPVPLQQTSFGQHDLESFAQMPTTGSTSFLVLPIKKQDRASFPGVTVGRTDNNDVVLSDVTVSKFHAFFREVDGDYQLQDAGSRNGTGKDNKPVPVRGAGPAVLLGESAALRFGSVQGTFLRLPGFLALAEEFGPDSVMG